MHLILYYTRNKINKTLGLGLTRQKWSINVQYEACEKKINVTTSKPWLFLTTNKFFASIISLCRRFEMLRIRNCNSSRMTDNNGDVPQSDPHKIPPIHSEQIASGLDKIKSAIFRTETVHFCGESATKIRIATNRGIRSDTLVCTSNKINSRLIYHIMLR